MSEVIMLAWNRFIGAETAIYKITLQCEVPLLIKTFCLYISGEIRWCFVIGCQHFTKQIPSSSSSKIYCRARGSGLSFRSEMFFSLTNNKSIMEYIDTSNSYQYRIFSRNRIHLQISNEAPSCNKDDHMDTLKQCFDFSRPSYTRMTTNWWN
jgi:hypothetical protein